MGCYNLKREAAQKRRGEGKRNRQFNWEKRTSSGRKRKYSEQKAVFENKGRKSLIKKELPSGSSR